MKVKQKTSIGLMHTGAREAVPLLYARFRCFFIMSARTSREE
jgi:hypothetical protein